MMLGLAFALAGLIGLSLSLLGSGGSIITLPVLVYVARIPAPEAVGMSLVIVGGTSAIGSLLKVRQGALDLRAASLFALTGMGGAFVGARFTHLVSAATLLLLFGTLLLIVGARMLQSDEPGTKAHPGPPLRCLATGVVVGVLTGFLGVGGGFLILPALVLFAGLAIKRAIGTSLAVIALNSLGGLIGHLRYMNLDWSLTLGFLLAALAGMLAGTRLANRLSAAALRRGFAWGVVLLGIALIARNATLLLPPD